MFKSNSLNPTKYSLLILLAFYLSSCVSSPDEVRPEDVEFTENKQEKYYSMGDKRNQSFLAEIEEIQESHVSFSADFSLRIDRYSPVKEKFYADGKIYFSKQDGRLKIQLMDNFFGLVFSEVLANASQVQVKASQDEKVHTQPMGDLVIHDPAKNKNITIPFPVIYYSITGNYKKEFSESPSFFSPTEKRVLVKKGKDEFTYFFDETRLTSLEWLDATKSLRAIAKTGDRQGFPPTNLVTKIMESGQETETVLIVTKLRNVKKSNPPDSVFTLK